MRHRSPARRAALVVLSVAAAAAWFTWLRPASLGGAVSYVVVQGESMEPTYEDGDLVLVREEAEYEHGDVIAFRADDAGGRAGDDGPSRVIHRIVGDAGDGAFRTQGDNRDRVDPWEPVPEDVIGRAILHVPMAGSAARFLVQPATFAALGGAAVVVGGERRRRRRRSSVKPEQPPQPQPQPSRHMRRRPATELATARPAGPSRLGRLTQPRWAFVGLICAVSLAVPVLAIAWSALRAPDSTQRIQVVGQLDYGIGFGYRFVGPPSPVYPSGEVTATRNAAGAVVPDGPLYSRLLDRLEVQLAFRATAEGADALASTYAVDVVVDTPGGWTTTVQSIEPTVLDGTATAAVAVDLRAIAAQVAAVGQLTGVGGEAYTIELTPTVELAGGTTAGEVQKRLTAPMGFTVENNVITANAIEAAEREDLTRTVADRATYAVGPFDLGTQAARGLLGGLALVLVAGIAWFASVLFGGLGLGEPERISARYRSQIVDVSTATAPPGPVVMVSAIDELARIARVEQTVIVHEDLGDGAHRYRVFLGTVTYEYETAPEHAGAAADPIDAPADEAGG
jgi:signal peptidase I